ncbi:MAG: ABC transporter permease, partial [Planctomycetota bacterium JB042]
GTTQIKVKPARSWGPGGSNRGRKIQIRYDDLDSIREACPSVGKMAAGTSPGMGGAVFGPSRSWPWARVMGVGHEYVDVARLDVVDGRWFTRRDEEGRLRVAVLNVPLAEGLFPEGSPLGQWVESSGRRFEIIGVVNDPEAFAYSFYIPYTAALTLGDRGGRNVEWISVQPVRPDLAREAIGEMRDAIGSLYSFDPDDESILSVEEQTGFIEQVNAVSRGLEWLILTIAGVALVLGCLGAANVVGITVAERTSEIGLRKALGATSGRVRGQVLIESLALCLGGGGLGVALGMFAVLALGPLQLGDTVRIEPRADVTVLSVGLGVLVMVGTFAGLPAANRAAALDPAVSLRDA